MDGIKKFSRGGILGRFLLVAAHHVAPAGDRHQYLHPLEGDELMNNSYVAVSPDGQWMLSGDFGQTSIDNPKGTNETSAAAPRRPRGRR